MKLIWHGIVCLRFLFLLIICIGARVVISHPQGREALEQQRKQHQDVIVSELPDKMTLLKVASDNSFEMAEFVDESGLYLAVLQFSGAKN